MQNVTSSNELKKAIFALQQRQIEEEKLFRKQLLITYESLKPINVLRNVIHELTTPSELKDGLIQTSASLIAGYLSRKIVVRSSNNPLLRFAGILVEYGVTNFVSNHSEVLRKTVFSWIRNLTGKPHK
jgi:hypothetical protein